MNRWNSGLSSTIDPGEVARFERLAMRWWDRAGPFWPLHRLSETRVNYLRQRLAEHLGRIADGPVPLHGLRLLDIGCGGGIVSESSRVSARRCMAWT